MALDFLFRSGAHPSRVAIFPGAWNPPTVAHLAMAEAAFTWAGEVILVLPRAMPHKGFDGASFLERCDMVARLAEARPALSAAVSSRGLYLEMAEEARETLGPAVEIGIVCGRDAAERMASWNYPEAGVFDRLVERFPLLVAARTGTWQPAGNHVSRVLHLALPRSFDEVSSTEIRARMAAGLPWKDLVPPAITAAVARIYQAPGLS